MSLEQSSPPDYLVGHVEEALACDPRVNEQGLHVAITPGKVFVTGTVSTRERFDAVAEVVGELLPDFALHNEATVADYPELGEEEHLA
jgi:osmotically-inducible protein OsmY